MAMKIMVLAFSLVVPLSYSFADEPVSISSLPFQSVDYLNGLNSAIVFDFVRLKGRIWKVSVPVDLVEVVLSENQMTHTTLNLVNAREEYGSLGWLKAEKAVVVVRQKSDSILWQKFLSSVKARQELERKKWAEPIRVLPPRVD